MPEEKRTVMLETINHILDDLAQQTSSGRALVFPERYSGQDIYPENIAYAESKGLEVKTVGTETVVAQHKKIFEVMSDAEAQAFFSRFGSDDDRKNNQTFFTELFDSIKDKSYADAIIDILKMVKDGDLPFEKKALLFAIQAKLTEGIDEELHFKIREINA